LLPDKAIVVPSSEKPHQALTRINKNTIESIGYKKPSIQTRVNPGHFKTNTHTCAVKSIGNGIYRAVIHPQKNENGRISTHV
jgi:hypothetical protein